MRRLVPLSAILLALALVALLTQPSTRIGASLKLASTVAASHMAGITTITTDTILILDEDHLIIGYDEKDCVAPQAAVIQLPSVSTAADVEVSWEGSDFYSGIASFDVQVKDGSGGSWTPWLTSTGAVRATYTGAHGHTYFFRTRARDARGNLETFENDEWGDAFTSVLLSPAAVMETSRKSAPTFFGPGQSVGYQIVLSNTGNLAGNIALADAVPLSMTLLTGTLSASSGPAPIFDGARITWTGSVAQGEAVLITYALTPTIGLGFMQAQTNRVTIEGGIVPVTRTAVASMARIVYLPIAMRSFTP